MQIGEEKPKYIHKKKPILEGSAADVIVSSESEEGMNQLNEAGEVKNENTFNKFFTGLNTKAQRALAKLGIWSGIISMISGAGSTNACKPIPANPFLIGLGLILIAASLLYLLWSFFN